MKRFLPIGSVVTLTGGTKKLMICGRIQLKAGENQVYDYSACFYPEGFQNPNEMYLFNHGDIENVYYIGMQDQDEFNFQAYMIQKIEEHNQQQD